MNVRKWLQFFTWNVWEYFHKKKFHKLNNKNIFFLSFYLSRTHRSVDENKLNNFVGHWFSIWLAKMEAVSDTLRLCAMHYLFANVWVQNSKLIKTNFHKLFPINADYEKRIGQNEWRTKQSGECDSHSENAKMRLWH